MGWVERDCTHTPFWFGIWRKEKHSHCRAEQPSSDLRENMQSRTTVQDSWAMPSALLPISPAMLLVSLNFLCSCPVFPALFPHPWHSRAGAAPRPCSSMREAGGTFPILLKSASQRLFHITSNKNSLTFPQVFITAV